MSLCRRAESSPLRRDCARDVRCPARSSEAQERAAHIASERDVARVRRGEEGATQNGSERGVERVVELRRVAGVRVGMRQQEEERARAPGEWKWRVGLPRRLWRLPLASSSSRRSSSRRIASCARPPQGAAHRHRIRPVAGLRPCRGVQTDARLNTHSIATPLLASELSPAHCRFGLSEQSMQGAFGKAKAANARRRTCSSLLSCRLPSSAASAPASTAAAVSEPMRSRNSARRSYPSSISPCSVQKSRSTAAPHAHTRQP